MIEKRDSKSDAIHKYQKTLRIIKELMLLSVPGSASEAAFTK